MKVAHNTVKEHLKFRNLIIGSWQPTHYASMYSDDSIQEIAYSTYQNNRLVFQEDGKVLFVDSLTDEVQKQGFWMLHNNYLTIDWGKTIVQELILDIDEHQFAKGNFFNNMGECLDTDKTLNYNKYHRVASVA